jgi:glycosyltransferase involved in cell wall biosynthesis
MRHSVIMPAFNAAAYIEQSLESALFQLGASDEVIVVDDGSTDATTEGVRKIQDRRVRLLSQTTNQGISAARNRALEVVRGDYVHFLDHDDLWSPDRLALLSSVIQAQQPDIISGWVEHFYCDSLTDSQRSQYHLPASQAAALPGSVVMRRELVKQIGLFDATLSSGEFIDYLSRAMALTPKWVKIDDVLFLRRIHANNHTLTNKSSNHAYIEVVRRHLVRRHLSGGRNP